MSCSLKEQKLAVDSGYVLLMRYNPDKEELTLDSKEPNFDLYDDFLSNEVRYRSLKMKNKDQANEILNLNKEVSINRYNYYKNLINKGN
jgi:pyruvate-ferredoxin/flavodoxin oxidoreductase